MSLVTLLSIAPTISYATGFKDASTHWAKSYIEYFHDKKILADSGNNTFSPEQHTTMEFFLKTLYRSINASNSTLLYPPKIQDNSNIYTTSTQESNPVISTEQNISVSSTNIDESITKQEEINTSQQNDAATQGETTSTNSIQEQVTIPIVTTVSNPKLSIPFQNSYTELVASTLYENGLLQTFTLNDKFLSSPLSRQRAVLICKNYDALRQSHGINSD